jgi:hypothetical protein
VKARSVNLTVYHFEPGHHREACVWHDQDHKAEVIGNVPDVFLSQRWVAPPELVALRPGSMLAHGGGEYVNMYWSASPPEKLEADFQVFGWRMRKLERMGPYVYMHQLWRRRLRPGSAHTRVGLPLSAEAVVAATHNTAMLLTIESAPAEYRRWHEAVHIPRVLAAGIANGAFKLMSAEADDRQLIVTCYYTDHPDPGAAYTEYLHLERTTGAPPPIHTGIYRPSIGFYDYYA